MMFTKELREMRRKKKLVAIKSNLKHKNFTCVIINFFEYKLNKKIFGLQVVFVYN